MRKLLGIALCYMNACRVINTYINLTLFFLDLKRLAKTLENQQAYTAFGKLPLGTEKSVPDYSFSVTDRDGAAKMYTGDDAKFEKYGKQSPGPIYTYDDKFKFPVVSMPLLFLCAPPL